MTAKNYKKAFVQLDKKSAKKKVYLKHNAPKKRTTGTALRKCKKCGTYRGVISSYGLGLCRRCFREQAQNLGFKKYD